MSGTQKIVSRQVGLEIGYICGKYFLKLDNLHYGYWYDGLKLDIANLHLAQEAYTKFILSNIPAGVKTVLDVGCGTGQVAKKLLEAGYKVNCVSPDPYLTKCANERLEGKVKIFETPYEKLETQDRYDMTLFSESFQYIKVEQAVAKCNEILNPGGYILICDFFRRDESKSGMSGGHNLTKFYKSMEDSPFKKITDIDITEQTAPNMDLMEDVMQNVVKPSSLAAQRFLESRHPLIVKAVMWWYRKKIEKTEKKYFSGERTAATFKKYKSYRLMVFKKNP